MSTQNLQEASENAPICLNFACLQWNYKTFHKPSTPANKQTEKPVKANYSNKTGEWKQSKKYQSETLKNIFYILFQQVIHIS